jgi:hypothetical protein
MMMTAALMKLVTTGCDIRLAMLPMRNTPSSSWNRPEYSASQIASAIHAAVSGAAMEDSEPNTRMEVSATGPTASSGDGNAGPDVALQRLPSRAFPLQKWKQTQQCS